MHWDRLDCSTQSLDFLECTMIKPVGISFNVRTLNIIIILLAASILVDASDPFQFSEFWKCKTSLPQELVTRGLADLHILDWLAKGTVKNVFIASLHGHRLVVSKLADPKFREDFQHNIRMHQIFDKSEQTARMLYSDIDTVVSEYHSKGSLLRALETIAEGIEERFPLCIQYVDILKTLHAQNRVMCDSNSLEKTLEQYLVSDDGKLLLNDMDALPLIENGGVRCGHQPIDGEFLAPEQRGEEGFKCGYDEKSDIFKIPMVCDAILGSSEVSIWFRYRISAVNKECRSESPGDRPSAAVVSEVYSKKWKEYLCAFGRE